MPVSAAPAAPRERFEVVTDVLRLSFDSEGGSLVRAELLQLFERSARKALPEAALAGSAAP